MDVYSYLPDVISYTSMRNPYLSQGNQPDAWSMEAPKDKRNKNVDKKKTKVSCEDCPICQERRRRPLASYIRTKSRQDRCTSASISEDSEELAEEDEEEVDDEAPVLKQEQGQKKPDEKKEVTKK